MDFQFLKNKISETDSFLAENAVKAVNIRLTLRNWLVGYYSSMAKIELLMALNYYKN